MFSGFGGCAFPNVEHRQRIQLTRRVQGGLPARGRRLKHLAHCTGVPPINVGHRQCHDSGAGCTARSFSTFSFSSAVKSMPSLFRANACSPTLVSNLREVSNQAAVLICSAAAELPTQPDWAAAIRLSDDKWAVARSWPWPATCDAELANASISTRKFPPAAIAVTSRCAWSFSHITGWWPAAIHVWLHGLQRQRRTGIRGQRDGSAVQKPARDVVEERGRRWR